MTELPQPQPIPTHFGVNSIVSPDYRGVVLQVTTATGSAVYFAPIHVARSLAGLLNHHAKEAEAAVLPAAAGLVIPGVDMSDVMKHLNNGEKG